MKRSLPALVLALLFVCSSAAQASGYYFKAFGTNGLQGPGYFAGIEDQNGRNGGLAYSNIPQEALKVYLGNDGRFFSQGFKVELYIYEVKPLETPGPFYSLVGGSVGSAFFERQGYAETHLIATLLGGLGAQRKLGYGFVFIEAIIRLGATAFSPNLQDYFMLSLRPVGFVDAPICIGYRVPF